MALFLSAKTLLMLNYVGLDGRNLLIKYVACHVKGYKCLAYNFHSQTNIITNNL